MTLLSGYSIIPVAPARRSAGMMSRTTDSSTMTSRATHFASAWPEMVGVCSAAEALPFPERRFDLILSHEVLEHVADDRIAAVSDHHGHEHPVDEMRMLCAA